MRKTNALALLRAGCSYGEASDRTGLTLEEVMDLWKEDEMKKTPPKPKTKPSGSKKTLKPAYQLASGGGGRGDPDKPKKA